MFGRVPRLMMTSILILLLVASAFFITLGTVRGPGGTGGTNSGGGTANEVGAAGGSYMGSHTLPPQLVVRAAIKQSSILYSTAYTNTSSLPTYLLNPLSGLEITLLQLGTIRARPFSIVTNATGIARTLLSTGAYSLQVSDPRFTMNTTIEARLNQTTVLDLRVGSAFLPVTFLEVSEPGGLSELFPWRDIWLNANTSGTSISFGRNEPVSLVSVEASSQASSSTGSALLVNATVKSTYAGGGGLWLAIRPLETSQFNEGQAVFLLVYLPEYEVTNVGG